MSTPPPTDAVSRERLLARVVLCVTLGVGAALRVWSALTDDGIYWPDEIYQSLEPAHRLVFGYGMQAWEFIDGARNWALPGLVAGLFQVSRGMGLGQPEGYLGVTRGAFALLGVASAWGAARLARVYGASALAAAAGASLFALGAVPLYFGPRALSENASALPAVLGLSLALAPTASRREQAAGASLLGLAVLLRLQLGVLAGGLVAVLLARREWKGALRALAVLTGWALVFGLLDKLTWGEWFHSARVYLEFNLIQGRAASFGTAPASYYGEVLWRSMAGPTALALGLGLLAARRAPGVLALAALFVALHMAQPHKELRFLVPVLPLFAALAGVGLDALLRHLPPSPLRSALPLAVVGVAGLSALGAGRLTFRDLGQYDGDKALQSAWDDFGSLNRLLTRAGKRPDLCGLKVEAAHLAWSGGYSYLHRDVPLFPGHAAGRDSGFYNYVLTVAGAEGAGEGVAAEGPFVLVRLNVPRCIPDANWTSRLP